MNREPAERIGLARERLAGADRVIIGGGAGLSAAAGLTYSGERFAQNFADFIRKYGMTDMYSAGFYPFRTQEEKWAYWSRHIVCNRWDPPALPLYRALQVFAAGRDCFVALFVRRHIAHRRTPAAPFTSFRSLRRRSRRIRSRHNTRRTARMFPTTLRLPAAPRNGSSFPRKRQIRPHRAIPYKRPPFFCIITQ